MATQSKTARAGAAQNKKRSPAKKPKGGKSAKPQTRSLVPEVVAEGRPPSPYDAGTVVPFARSLAESGKTDVEIAVALGVHYTTYNDWRKRHPEFAEAVSEGKALVDARVERAFLQRATGFTSQIPYVNAEGEERVRTVVFPPSVPAAIEWLRNRQPEHWMNRAHITVGLRGVPGQVDTSKYSRSDMVDIILGKRTE
jgi:hypothetical protein